MYATLRRFLREEEGAALTEYGLLVGLIALACVAALTNLGSALADMFQRIADRIGGIALPDPPPQQ